MQPLFGTDGVRGVANSELTPELAFRIGRYATHVLLKRRPEVAEDSARLKRLHDTGVATVEDQPIRPRVLIAKDTRRSGDMLEAALAAGFCAAGSDVYLAGILPTPGLAVSVAEGMYDVGVMITASHNAAPFNGIKLFDHRGRKLPDEMEDAIEAYVLARRADDLPRPVGNGIGRIVPDDEARRRYLERLRRIMGSDLSGLKLVLDTAHGAATSFAPDLFRSLGATVTEVLGHAPDGDNINDRCGSTHLFGIAEAVPRTGADMGFAFDGDADRVLVVDAEGRPVEGDGLLAILAAWLVDEDELRGGGIAATVMSNMGLDHYCRDLGIRLYRTPVGDRYVRETMDEVGLNLGGEQSGHIILGDYTTTGDGMLTALALCRALRARGETVRDAVSSLPVYPQVLVPAQVPNALKADVMADPTLKAYLQTMEARPEVGRLLVRPSGTEPLIRIMLEGPSETAITETAYAIRDEVLRMAARLGGDTSL